MTTLVILMMLWLLALEVRFHGLNHLAAESKQLAKDAAASAERLAQDAASAVIGKIRGVEKKASAKKPVASSRKKS